MVAHFSWMAELLSEFEQNSQNSPRERAADWLQQQGVPGASLTPLSGYTNHVFLVESSTLNYPQRSVLRLADFSLSVDLCPLAHQFTAVLQRHIDAAALGLAPEVVMADQHAGIMWLSYVGDRNSLGVMDFVELKRMLTELYQSGVDWGTGGQIGLETLLTDLLASNIEASKAVRWQTSIRRLLTQAGQRGYFERPLVSIHGDLNPGNLLHDGTRWWLIDWDFAGMQLREWDLAGLIVEHDWSIEQALAFAPEMARADLKWFCGCFALLSWYWHVQRGSDLKVISSKAATMQYWITLRG